VDRAAGAIAVWIADGIETAMNRFNAESVEKRDQKDPQ
jgi:hypothetical protein